MLRGLSDPRIDELLDRVSAIEHKLNDLLKSAKASDEVSPAVWREAPVSSDSADVGDDADQFAVRTTVPEDLSLSSQVAEMSAMLSKPPSPKPRHGNLIDKVEALVELPDHSSLEHLLDVYFGDMDNYFPFLDRVETESSIYSVLRRLGYSSYNRVLVVGVDDYAITALAFIMIALAECIDSGACDGVARPGWETYLQTCRLLHTFSKCKKLDTNVVRAQCLVAAYLMQSETLGAASEAIHKTWILVTRLRMNNKQTWLIEEPITFLQRQRLWWTIYFLDRQISRRSGLAYHIRDTEFDVDDFAVNESMAEPNSMQRLEWGWSIPGQYLQALINIGRLWGHAWDSFFAVGAAKKRDWLEVEVMDVRILNIRRLFPDTLTWNSDQLTNYILSGEDARHIRRRLQLFTVSESVAERPLPSKPNLMRII